jgi:uncharacterized metal-binding protein YceD (DUF177 family)
MKESGRVSPEFSRPLAVDSIGAQHQQRRIEADRAERERLARRFDLLALDRLEATLELSRHKDDLIQVKGRLVADAVQSCVITLAPVPAHVEADFETSFSPSAVESLELDFDPLGEDLPEPITDGEIDLGEAVAQQLAIALDPYPKAPGASLEAPGMVRGAGSAAPRSPFAGLARLKKKP